MSLQRFKMDVASAVVNQDNMSLAAMDTSTLLDLFVPPGGEQQLAGQQGGGAGAGRGTAAGVGAAGEVVAGGAGRRR